MIEPDHVRGFAKSAHQAGVTRHAKHFRRREEASIRTRSPDVIPEKAGLRLQDCKRERQGTDYPISSLTTRDAESAAGSWSERTWISGDSGAS